jgi:hypothetical protein
MFKRWINWLKGNTASGPVRAPEQRRRTAAYATLHGSRTASQAPQQQLVARTVGHGFAGRIQNIGPGNNARVRDVEAIDDTGAREMLRLFDSSPQDSSEPTGIDPYNSGQFDRSRQWDSRFRN